MTTAVDGLRNITAAASWLGVPKSWLRDKVTARAVPHTRVGRHVRFAQHHLDAIVAAGEEPVATAPSRATVTAIRAGQDPPRTEPQKTAPPPAAPRTPPPPAGPKRGSARAAAA